MKRRFLIIAVVFAAVVAITLGVLAMLPPRPGISKANLDRIETGMSEEDVIAVFGRAADVGAPILSGSACYWSNEDQSTAAIEFDLDFSVRKTEWRPGPSETILDKLRRLLHLD